MNVEDQLHCDLATMDTGVGLTLIFGDDFNNRSSRNKVVVLKHDEEKAHALHGQRNQSASFSSVAGDRLKI